MDYSEAKKLVKARLSEKRWTGKAGAAGAAGSADFFRKSKKPIVKLSFISPVRRAYL